MPAPSIGSCCSSPELSAALPGGARREPRRWPQASPGHALQAAQRRPCPPPAGVPAELPATQQAVPRAGLNAGAQAPEHADLPSGLLAGPHMPEPAPVPPLPESLHRALESAVVIGAGGALGWGSYSLMRAPSMQCSALTTGWAPPSGYWQPSQCSGI
jgi:hypothetical protein